MYLNVAVKVFFYMRLTFTSVNVGGPYKSVEDLERKDGPLLKKREFLQPTAFGLKLHAHQLFPGYQPLANPAGFGLASLHNCRRQFLKINLSLSAYMHHPVGSVSLGTLINTWGHVVTYI